MNGTWPSVNGNETCRQAERKRVNVLDLGGQTAAYVEKPDICTDSFRGLTPKTSYQLVE